MPEDGRHPDLTAPRTVTGSPQPAAPPSPLNRAARVSLVVIASLAALAALSEASLFAIPSVLAALAAVALAGPAARLERLGLRPGAAAALLLIGALVGIAALAALIAPSYEAIRAELPRAADRLEDMAADLERAFRTGSSEEMDRRWTAPADADGATGGEDQGDAAAELMKEGQGALIQTLRAAPAQIGAAVYGIFLTYFLIADRARIARGLIAAAGRSMQPRLHMARGLAHVRTLLSRYLGAITVVNVCLGLATAGLFHLVGVPSAPAWGAAMTFLNFAPYLGPVVMNAAVLAVGVATFDDPGLAFVASGALIVLNTLEGYLITPSVVGRQIKVSALAIFLAVAFGAWLWGWAGALLATPVLITLRVAARLIQRTETARPATS